MEDEKKKEPKDLEKEILELEKKEKVENKKSKGSSEKQDKKQEPQKTPQDPNNIELMKEKEKSQKKASKSPVGKQDKKQESQPPRESKDIGLMKEKTGKERKEKTGKERKEEEKIKFLKRDDIRTMKKDIRKIRETKADQEGKDISLLGLKKEKRKKKEKEEKTEQETPVVPEFSKKSKSSRKILVRAAFVLVLLLIGGGSYWFFTTQENLYNPPVVIEEEEEEEKEEIFIPESFASVNETLSINLGEKQKIVPASQELKKEELSEEGLNRIIFKDHEGKPIPLSDIEKLFNIEISSELLKKLHVENYNLMGTIKDDEIEKSLIIKTTEALSFPLSGWESEVETTLLEEEQVEEEQTETPEEEEESLFQDFKAQERDIRCLKSSSDYSLSLCYTVINNYLILAESFEGAEQSIAGINDLTRKKIGQLFIVSFEGTTLSPELENFFRKYYPGGILIRSQNVLSSYQINSLVEDLQALSLETTDNPLIVAINQEGGSIVAIDFLDELTTQSEIATTTESYQVGLERGKELKKLGVNLNLSPLMDMTGEDDFIHNRTFQKEPEIAGQLGKYLISGYQEAGIFSAVKYFPGYTGMLTNPNQNLMLIESIPPVSQFKEAMLAEPKFIVTANYICEEIDNDLPFSFSEEAIKYLKQNLGRSSLVITDDLSSNALSSNYSPEEIVTYPIRAGVDLELVSGSVEKLMDAFLKAVNDNNISLEEINKPLSRIKQLKEEL